MVQETQTPLRIVTASSLFDGHDSAINIMRRLLQASGAEVIHLGHNRSASEVAACALQEDAGAVAVSSYQGGHMEYFTYLRSLLDQQGGTHIRIFGGGGGTILPAETEELEAEGVCRIYSPDDGARLGLQGMIDDLMARCAGDSDGDRGPFSPPSFDHPAGLARWISLAENQPERYREEFTSHGRTDVDAPAPVLGVTGTGGAGKSSVVDELVRRFLLDGSGLKLAIVSVDPTRKRSGGALLGDRIRMNAIDHPDVYMRSMATRRPNLALPACLGDVIGLLRTAGAGLIVLETSGIGQSDTEIMDYADLALYVMTPEYGASTQLEKIDMLDYADVIAINKSDKQGAADALREVRKQYRRNRRLFDNPDADLPVLPTCASEYADPGMDRLFSTVTARLAAKTGAVFNAIAISGAHVHDAPIPASRIRYLSEIASALRQYDRDTEEQAQLAGRLQSLRDSLEHLSQTGTEAALLNALKESIAGTEAAMTPENLQTLQEWPQKASSYRSDEYTFTVRGKEIHISTYNKSLANSKIPKIALPNYMGWRDQLRWLRRENLPGEFPFTAGVFPFRRELEEPTRMFAGEGAPERTNHRFHFLTRGQPYCRLSTAFDSVTLYGEDPGRQPDLYGKIGNSGVSVCCLDDAKKLYSGFDLLDPGTSVSMTINGPAPAMTAFFLLTAIDQQCERYLHSNGLVQQAEELIASKYNGKDLPRPRYHGPLPEGHDGLGLLLLGISGEEVLPGDIYSNIAADTLRRVRGTVQADILKEDQAQNTCIFSIGFSLRLMGDMQAWFIENQVRNFYSVSVSGYHMAEAGANPITQLAFTLANGFTYAEYYRSRGMAVDDFAPNFSFFFSNGIEPEYAVIGRVARRIWSKAMKYCYGAGERAQKLKYHIQTSGRSLHAREISFNDIRTTLQALYAVYDNCNSLHTNAYDEALTTPTEESVRRAQAIQLIINRELGLAKNQNPLQGSFIVEELTDLVEEAVLLEFDRLSERGGVLGAMERMYQRARIQDESLHYESLKHSGAYPIIGVNTFVREAAAGGAGLAPLPVTRAETAEKERQIASLEAFHKAHRDQATPQLKRLTLAARGAGNAFPHLMEAAKSCSLGELTRALYQAGGRYRRNM
jgi:isobutyryl-CoA mutase